MKIVLAGGSGLIGRKLILELLHAQHEIIVLSRTPENMKKYFPGVHSEFWDAQTAFGLINILEGTDVIINLAGESIAARRWTSDRKERILSSRIQSTRAFIDVMKKMRRAPRVLLNASAIGYYGNVLHDEITETYPRGQGFLSEVCEHWEMEALKAQELGVRVVILRTGVVLDPNGGALRKLLPAFRFGFGGPIGNGRQWFSWIHIQDEIRAILFAIDHKQISGPLNLAAPHAVQMKEFCRVLGRVLHRPSWLPIPGLALRILLGEMAGPLLLQGQRVIPLKLSEAGFKFRFSNLENALRDILR
jgi:uncharacterized protein